MNDLKENIEKYTGAPLGKWKDFTYKHMGDFNGVIKGTVKKVDTAYTENKKPYYRTLINSDGSNIQANVFGEKAMKGLEQNAHGVNYFHISRNNRWVNINQVSSQEAVEHTNGKVFQKGYSPGPNANELKKVMLANWKTLVPQMLPGGKWQGNEYEVRNPMRKDNRPGSFKISSKGMWKDFANNKSGGPIALYGYLHGYGNPIPNKEFGKVVKELDEKLKDPSQNLKTTGFNIDPNKEYNPENFKVVKMKALMPIPEDKLGDLKKNPTYIKLVGNAKKFGNKITMHEFKNQDGKPMYYRMRIDSNKGKTIVPFSYGKLGDKIGWQAKAPSDPMPLYGLDTLKKKGPVLIVEGEKAANAAQKIFPKNPVVSISGGSNNVSKNDWAPLKKRQAVLWPDNDEAGQHCMDAVKKELEDIGSPKVTKVKLPKMFDKPGLKGWDLADRVRNDPQKDIEAKRKFAVKTISQSYKQDVKGPSLNEP